MFVDDFRKEFYDNLVGKRVLLMVHHDVDALCAIRILLHLLEADNIQYSLVSIRNKEEFVKTFNAHQQSASNIVLINFGATFDVYDEIDCSEDKCIYIIDNHRPVDVHNVYRPEVKLVMRAETCKNIPLYEDLFRDSDEEDEGDERRYSLEMLEKRKERRVWKERRLRLLFEYTQFSYFGHSVAFQMFELAWKMSKDNFELLWLAIIGVCDLRVNDKIDEHMYEESLRSLKSHLTRLTHAQNSAGNNSIDIVFDKDLQLVLYRHWSLFESFRHTLLCSSRFKVWNVKGYKRMLEFFAEIGIPLVQCKQKFFAMDLEFRKNSQQWIDELAEKYSLIGIVSNSFVGSRGFRHRYNANDIALGVKAILESPNKEKSSGEKFLEALDSLSPKKISILHHGIEAAKIQYEAIWKQVHATLEMKSIVNAGPFLYVILHESAPDAKLFSFAGCLLTLARFLLHSHVASSRSRRVANLPLILITPDLCSTEFALAAGIPPVAEQSPNNLLGKALLQAAQRLKCPMEPDFYDGCVVRFPVEEKLHLIDALVSLLS
ncbi:Cell division control protein 45-like protein [Dinothrombium tinctorium]|uniref:Cell division control protein 45-like protein n=1 Tax=Dinothrombium tinctorium TaxID=1965070 RepID=A0A443QPK0_9ACAR|nr:Cell division control protein 45-like protein [Dinothrombium tinctorium]RWS05143.1 Cell division control protein 45-like protein [Dinothrombium tinctorium]RWS05618.1 Cell division control protein 45-like protein [Dinothrombium tinctorium]